jgi:ribosome-binding protein aMBF1 (putative translation factor)
MGRARLTVRDLQHAWSTFTEQAASWAVVLANFVTRYLDADLVRALGLIAVVLLTISVMGMIYGGKTQNAFCGPVRIRKHANSQLSKHDIRMTKALLNDAGLDRVRADCDVYYTYTDSRGKPRRHRVTKIDNSMINIVPDVRAIQGMIDGQELSQELKDLAVQDVVIPTPESDPNINTIQPTPQNVGEYVVQNKVLEGWTDDDFALRVSMHENVIDEINAARESHILSGAQALREAREGNWFARLSTGRLARQRPAIIGSYYLKFRHSRNPLFILTRHPDRDLKMAAWLTLLTSLFAMLMEAWPTTGDRIAAAPTTEVVQRVPSAGR